MNSLSRIVAIAVALGAFSFSAGCSDDCTRLADQVCERVGEEHDECKRIRIRADSASQDDKRACSKALAVTDLLTPRS